MRPHRPQSPRDERQINALNLLCSRNSSSSEQQQMLSQVARMLTESGIDTDDTNAKERIALQLMQQQQQIESRPVSRQQIDAPRCRRRRRDFVVTLIVIYCNNDGLMGAGGCCSDELNSMYECNRIEFNAMLDWYHQ